MNTYLIAFNPNLTPELKDWIRKNIVPSMIDINWVSHQYELNIVIDEVENNHLGTKKDLELIQEMYEGGVGYIEI